MNEPLHEGLFFCPRRLPALTMVVMNDDTRRYPLFPNAVRWALILAIAVRLLYCFAVYPKIAETLHWQGVDDGYDEIARHLHAGDGYVNKPGQVPNLLTPPGYVFFLYALYGVVGTEINEGPRVQIAHIALDCVTLLLITRLALLLFASPFLAGAAGFAWALYPQIVVYNARVAPEILFTLLTTATVFWWVRTVRKGSVREAILLGIFWGIAVLTKEKLVLLPAVIAFSVLLQSPGTFGVRAKRAALVIVVMLITIAPWLARGYAVTGTFVPITMRSGRAIDQGLDENFAGADDQTVDFHTKQKFLPRNEQEAGLSDEERAVRAAEGAQREKALIGESLARILEDPVTFVKAFFVKLGAFWYFGQPRVIIGNMIVQLPILLLAIPGYALAVRRYSVSPLLWTTLYFLFIHAVTIVRMRYSIPIMPETILLALFFLLRYVYPRRLL